VQSILKKMDVIHP